MTLEQREIGYSFDITDPAQPLWVLVVYNAAEKTGNAETDNAESHVYEVKINAKTGEVTKTIVYNGEGSFDGYYF